MGGCIEPRRVAIFRFARPCRSRNWRGQGRHVFLRGWIALRHLRGLVDSEAAATQYLESDPVIQEAVGEGYVMKRFRMFIICVGLFLVSGAGAQTPQQGLLNAVAYDPLPTQVSINVRPLNDSDENLSLKQDFETALRERGHTVDVDAPLVLSFETREAAGAWADRGRRTVLELEASGEGVGGDQQRVHLNLFNSSSGGVFNRGNEGGTGIVTPSHFRIDLSIDDRSNGERLWQAWAVADIGRSDGRRVSQAMVPGMIARLGETVRQEQIDLF